MAPLPTSSDVISKALSLTFYSHKGGHLMKPLSSHLKISTLIALLALGLVSSIKIISSTAQTPQQNNSESTTWKVIKTGPRNLKVKPTETDPQLLSARVIEDQIPSHLPIKVELQNLDSEKLLDKITVKVTNTSKKPIYYLDFQLVLPDVLSARGNPLGFPLRYGRIDLIEIGTPIRPDDVPLQSGEVHVLKIPEKDLEGFKQHAASMSLTQSELKRVYLFFYSLNFGDGTGFSSTNGEFIDIKKKPSNDSCKGGENKVSIEPARKSLFSLISFTTVNDLAPKSLSQAGLCCAGALSCVFAKPATYACNCGNGRTYEVTVCHDPVSKCRDIFPTDRTCPSGQPEPYHCPELLLVPCAAYCDRDNDGWYSVSCGGLDCNDNDPNIDPFSPECNGGGGPIVEVCPTGGGFEGGPYFEPMCPSPIVIDVAGNGFNLTDAAGGVQFDLNNDGTANGLSWTAAGSDDAWLACLKKSVAFTFVKA
jgi:hypothetical protein